MLKSLSGITRPTKSSSHIFISNEVPAKLPELLPVIVIVVKGESAVTSTFPPVPDNAGALYEPATTLGDSTLKSPHPAIKFTTVFVVFVVNV